MIDDLHENEFGNMEGTFYSEIFGYNIMVTYDKGISPEYVLRNIEYLNNLDNKILEDICAALKRFYDNYKEILPDLCEEIEEDILKDYEENPLSILKYVNIGVYKFDECKKEEEEIPVINLRGDCEWSGDEGVTIAVKNNQILYVGPWENYNVWNGSDSGMFNYAR